jgi:tetratricopeptide (TPR) repeat protein
MKNCLIRIPVYGLLRAALWVALAMVCIASAPATAWDQNPQGKCVDPRGCGSSPGPGGGGYTDPSGGLFGRLFSGPSAADKADQQARAANEQGVQAYKKGDWATAVSLFQQALQNDPNDPTYRQNLANARSALEQQQRQEKEAMDRQRQNKAAADNMQQSIQSFAQTLNAAPVAGGLDFDGRTAGTVPGGGKNSGLDFTAAIATPSKAKPATVSPSGDPMVVDARKVPSGLPKALDNAIAKAYASAPPGVSDRVRKGFQAVMDRDWKVAKAWFQDALNRDPNNAGLKRLVALTDSSQQPNPQPATVDNRNEPAALGGKSNHKGAFATPSQTKPANDPNLILPTDDDMWVIFPGMKDMEDKEALDYLFGLNAQPSSSKTGKAK